MNIRDLMKWALDASPKDRGTLYQLLALLEMSGAVDKAPVIMAPIETEVHQEATESLRREFIEDVARLPYGKTHEAKFKGRTNAEVVLRAGAILPKVLRGIGRKPVDRQRVGDPPSQKFTYDAKAPWAKKMWTLLLTTPKSGLSYSPEELAKKCGSTPKLVGMWLLNRMKRPRCPLVREKRDRTFFYKVVHSDNLSQETKRLWVKP
jgi:hypothetical protein